MEDCAAVTGVAIAATCLTLSNVLNNPMIDSLGSISIGVLLTGVAMFLIRRNVAGLVGTRMEEAKEKEIIKLLADDPVIDSVEDVKSASMGPEWARFKGMNGADV